MNGLLLQSLPAHASDQRGRLTISPVTPHDSGEYHCEAAGIAGVRLAIVRLAVDVICTRFF